MVKSISCVVVVALVTAVCFVLTPSFGYTQAGNKASDSALQSAMDARQKAIESRNAAEWGKYTADDFVLITADGTMQTRAERMKMLATNTNKPNPVTIDKVTMFGADA